MRLKSFLLLILGLILSIINIAEARLLYKGEYAPCQTARPTYNCRCADLGAYETKCLDAASYCRAFGNIGAR